MLDNIFNTVKRGAERVQRRSEEVAQVARLKMEVFGLTRELDGHYARLGRAYHSGADLDLLQGIRDDIQRAEEDIAGRERLITELSADDLNAAEDTGAEAAQTGAAKSDSPKPAAATPSENGVSKADAPDLPERPNASNSPAFMPEQPGSANSQQPGSQHPDRQKE